MRRASVTQITPTSTYCSVYFVGLDQLVQFIASVVIDWQFHTKPPTTFVKAFHRREVKACADKTKLQAVDNNLIRSHEDLVSHIPAAENR